MPATVRSCTTNVLILYYIKSDDKTLRSRSLSCGMMYMRTWYVHGQKACRIRCFDNSAIRISIEPLKPRFSVKTRNVDGDYDIIVINIVVIMTTASARLYERQTNPNAVTVPIL